METLSSSTIIIGIMVMFVVVLIAIVFMLLAQKQFNITNVPITVEDFLNHLYTENTKANKDTNEAVKVFVHQLQSYEEQHEKTKDGLNNFIAHIMEELSGTKEHVAAIQQLALEKEKKIKRYESGYDYSKIKNFTNGLFKIIEFIEQENLSDNNETLKEIKEDMLSVLENNGVEQIAIQVNDDYRQYAKVAKVIETVATDNPEKDSKIKEVIKQGYKIEINDDMTKVLKPSEVIVYKLTKGIENV